MLRLHGVPLPGFAIGTLMAIILLITTPLSGLSGEMIGLISVGSWILCDGIAAAIVSKETDGTDTPQAGADPST